MIFKSLMSKSGFSLDPLSVAGHVALVVGVGHSAAVELKHWLLVCWLVGCLWSARFDDLADVGVSMLGLGRHNGG